jgi:deoxycytidylate deaminase
MVADSAVNASKQPEVPSPLAAVSPLSKELVVAMVGYAGAGCSTARRRLEALLHASGYLVHVIQLSDLISARAGHGTVPRVESSSLREGETKFERATRLQDLGDEVRNTHGAHAIAALAIKEIMRRRGAATHGQDKIAYILDSLKHSDEVSLLRKVYDVSFRLISVHCERSRREARLIGKLASGAKFRGVDPSRVQKFMDRDEKDAGKKFGQAVRDAFYLGDYFIDNNADSQEGLRLNGDIQRFIDLVLGNNLVRPTNAERGMFHAHAAGLQSSCLSRQVGAALQTVDGRLVATGTNDVPRFGGGLYGDDTDHDNRCHVWEFNEGEVKFVGCHNTRRKNRLRNEISEWFQRNFIDDLAKIAHPSPREGLDTAREARKVAEESMRQFLFDRSQEFDKLPGVRDLIEFSRSIHAEMDAILNAARSGFPPQNTILYCTTFPCHSCARHLVAAGVKEVYYIEPYVKSLAMELHSDSIQTEVPSLDAAGKRAAPRGMLILPFTGVGPRMYEDYFLKRTELKAETGAYQTPASETPPYAVRLREAAGVEASAANLVPD